MQLATFSDCGFGGGATAAGPGPGQVLLEALHKVAINDLLLFAETRFCDSSQMKSMADFGPTREGDQLRARDPRRKKIILESKKHKVEFVHF